MRRPRPATPPTATRAVALYRALGDRYEEAGTLSRLGDTAQATGVVDAARAAWQRAAELLSNLRHPDAGPGQAAPPGARQPEQLSAD